MVAKLPGQKSSVGHERVPINDRSGATEFEGSQPLFYGTRSSSTAALSSFQPMKTIRVRRSSEGHSESDSAAPNSC